MLDRLRHAFEEELPAETGRGLVELAIENV
jgi:hypothetical protein